MTHWFYSTDNKQRLGPVTSKQLRQLALSGVLHPEHMVMREDTGTWVPARKVKGLFPESPQPAAPSTSPVPSGKQVGCLCPACGSQLNVDERMVSAWVNCPRCGNAFIPSAAALPIADVLPADDLPSARHGQGNVPLTAVGTDGQVTLLEHSVRISRHGAVGFLLHGQAGDREIYLSSITSVEFQEAGALGGGYIRFIYPGAVPHRRGGFLEALTSKEPSRSDENSVGFSKKQRPEFVRLKRAIDERLAQLRR